MSGSGANPFRGEAALEVGGEPRLLRPSFAALVSPIFVIFCAVFVNGKSFAILINA